MVGLMVDLMVDLMVVAKGSVRVSVKADERPLWWKQNTLTAPLLASVQKQTIETP